MRVLVVTNMTPDPAAPSRGIFVRDQVAALRRRGIDVELLSFPGGGWNYPRAVPQIRRLLRRERFDLVHAHFGLAGWWGGWTWSPAPPARCSARSPSGPACQSDPERPQCFPAAPI